MKTSKSSPAKGSKSSKAKTSSRGRTDVEGQNPKANDSPDQDEYHDDNRRNQFDPEVAKSLAGAGSKPSRKR